MRFERVRIAGLGYDLPERVVTSTEIESELAPLYERLKLSAGRLELMSGIRERRFYAPGTLPSAVAARAGERALAQSGIARGSIGCLIHASVCRDYLEPATASVVHAALELREDCLAFDLSNACLGVADALLVIAPLIERGAIDAGLIVAGEDGRALVDETLRALRADPYAGRAELKRAYASLTIGSGGAALVLARGEPGAPLSLHGGIARAATGHHELCRGDQGPGAQGPLMETDAEALLAAGNALAARTWPAFLDELHWTADSVARIVTHQVGAAHRRALLETLALPASRDYPTYERLGNMGSVSLPLSLALALEEGWVANGERTALLGIGSGLHCAMLGLS